MKEKKCEICGRAFMPKTVRQIYCSTGCEAESQRRRQTLPPREAVCPICGTTFRQKGTRVYCSLNCRRESDRQRGAAWRKARKEREQTEPRRCRGCGALLEEKTYRRRYCSRDCFLLYQGLAAAEKKRREKPEFWLSENMTELQRLAREAREAGMSYGYYVAASSRGKRW